MQKENIIISSIEKSYEVKTYVGCQPVCKVTSITVKFFLTYNFQFKGEITIETGINLTEEEIKDKIIEVLE